MKIYGICIALALSSPVAAAEFSARDAAACFIYANATRRIALANAASTVSTAYGSYLSFLHQGRAFLDKIRSVALIDRRTAARVMVSEGRSGCLAIGVM